MRLGNHKTERGTLNAIDDRGKAVEISAGDLASEDIGRWMFWESDIGIETLKIKSITHVTQSKDHGYGKTMVSLTGDNVTGVTLTPEHTVYVCVTKPKITVLGVEIPEK
ncbi:hypothetical protein SEA_ELINAL_69 [Gordonia phage Elinal]|nr:hypothetical protein SEA_ELINAL_69 [Gordonia phage Elinal]